MVVNAEAEEYSCVYHCGFCACLKLCIFLPSSLCAIFYHPKWLKSRILPLTKGSVSISGGLHWKFHWFYFYSWRNRFLVITKIYRKFAVVMYAVLWCGIWRFYAHYHSNFLFIIVGAFYYLLLMQVLGFLNSVW